MKAKIILLSAIVVFSTCLKAQWAIESSEFTTSCYRVNSISIVNLSISAFNKDTAWASIRFNK